MAALLFPGSSLDANTSWPWPVQAAADYQLNTVEAPTTWFAVPVTTGLIGLFATWRLYREKFGDGKARTLRLSKSERDAAVR
jgi:hypothetical protein